MGVPKLPENGISWALYVGDFLLEGVSQWTPCPNGPQSPLLFAPNFKKCNEEYLSHLKISVTSLHIVLKLFTSHKLTILKPTHPKLRSIVAPICLKVWSFVVIRGHSWSFVDIRGRSQVSEYPHVSVPVYIFSESVIKHYY